MKILLVEDEDKLARFLLRGLREEGHGVDHCAFLEDARARLALLAYDVVILDWVLPDGDGVALLERMRRDGDRTPVLMLTARGTTPEKVLGLRSGADDYVSKPFDFEELLARLEALRRRSDGIQTDRALGDVVLDDRRRCLRAGRLEVALTAREHALLGEFFAHAGDVRTRAQLLTAVWGHGFEGDPNILDVYVGYVRKKLAELARGSDDARPLRIPTLRAVRGVGFRLALESEGEQ